ncbi:MAG TPA: hypothetical protein VMB91_05420 [Solirubrobacteraceae bacterium]|nr:hypothetical protein [Solirubrobacteraceae bacterium]
MAVSIVAIGSCAYAGTGTASARKEVPHGVPQISSFRADPTIVASGGTTVVTASISISKKCKLSATPKLTSLKGKFPCEAQPSPTPEVDRELTLPANTGTTPVNYVLTLTADGYTGKKASATAVVTVRPSGPTNGGVKAVAAGGRHTCALLSSGHIDCWGDNTYGQLGVGKLPHLSDTPLEVKGISNAIQVTATERQTCALLSTGHIDCWGENDFGELGDGTQTASAAPVEVAGITDATQVTNGPDHACAVLSGGHVDCWGGNGGQLGIGTSEGPETCVVKAVEGPCSKTPVEVPGITDAIGVAAGAEHTCVLLATGQVDCWGRNGYGQLGTGTDTGPEKCEGGEFGYCYTAPVEVMGVSGAVELSAGSAHSCVLLAAGNIDCWGEDHDGELGNGIETPFEPAVEVQGISEAAQVVAGGRHTCALLSSGHIECWGAANFGDGVEFQEESLTPVEPKELTNVTQVAANLWHTCALQTDGDVDCWGEDKYGELGDGTTKRDEITPVEVVGL